MPRPTTKQSLLEAAEKGFKELFGFAEAMSEEERCAEFLFEDRDRNIRDVFVHLYEWHRLLLNFVENNRRGVTAAFLPLPYNWKTYPQMNVEIWKKYQSTSCQTAEQMLMRR